MARRVAIVEDDFDQRENYRDALQKSGYEVDTYKNRPEALAGMRADMPDLAILDIMDTPDPVTGRSFQVLFLVLVLQKKFGFLFQCFSSLLN